MPFNLGPGELIFLAAAALLLFGPQKLPEIGRALGEALGSLKRAYNSAASLEDLQLHSSQSGSRIVPAEPQASASQLQQTSDCSVSSESATLNSEPK